MKNRGAGYAFLIDKYRLDVIPNWHESQIGQAGVLRETIREDRVASVYPSSYWPGSGVGDHLEFALKYDGVNLGILSALFEVIPGGEVAAWVAGKPTGKYARRIWFLYEWLTGEALTLPDLTMGNYVEVLEPGLYVTTPGRRVARQRVIDNLLGGPAFCPMVRRTGKLAALDETAWRRRCEAVVAAYPPELLGRALSYLYGKESRSSFAIERLEPSASRIERFIALLGMAERQDFCEKSLLLEVQNRMVDARFRDSDYRITQSYVGEVISPRHQRVHYVCPRPDDLPGLMDGLLLCHRMMTRSDLAAVHAAVISYGFVFLHPFEDGNGRIHRFLIHNILSLRGVTPPGLMFPISATLLKDPARYDRSLEAFSAPLMALLDYDLDEDGLMTVHGETGRWYRFIDMTAQAEALVDFVETTIDHELKRELDFLVSHDKTKRAIQEIVDMPDRQIDLFIQFCLQNHGHLAARKRASHFDFLRDDELADMEGAVRAGYGAIN